MNKFITFIIIALIVLGIIFFLQQQSTSPEIPLPTQEPSLIDIVEGSDTTSAIDQDLDDISIGDLDQEFGDIDADLDSL